MISTLMGEPTAASLNLLLQPAPAWTAIVTAIGIAIIATAVLVVTLLLLVSLRQVRRTLQSLERTVTRLSPHAEPILERAARVAEDAAAISYSLRRSTDSIQKTVEDINEQVRKAADVTEARVRRLGKVLQVAQDEAESVLLDAAATARGLQATAEALRRHDEKESG